MIAPLLADQTILSMYFCVAQVTILAAMGTLATRWLIPRRPELASTVACVFVAVITLLTLAVPVSVPRWLVIGATSTDELIAIGENDTKTPHAPEAAPVVPASRRDAGLMIDVPALLQQVALQWHPDPATSQSISIPLAALALLGFGTLIGVLRFALSIAATLLLTRRAHFVTDNRALQMLWELCSKLDVRQSIKLLESQAISSAAVCGSVRARILLPSDWRQWSDAELRSVLAHELAHIARGDFAWRAISAAAGAVHFFNPFVHQLIHSMVLAQELTADVSAAGAVERTTYIRSLSALALRREQSDTGCTGVGIAPVFSGFLIRRIKMLNDKKDFGLRRTSFAMRLAVAASVISCGLVTFTMRGYAEPPTAGAPSEDQTAAEPAARIARVASRPESTIDPIAGLFQRKTVNPEDIEENENGMFEMRVADILNIQDFASLAAIANSGLAGELKGYFETDKAPTVQLQWIDVVYGSTQVTVRQDPEQAKSRLMFGWGSTPLRIQFTRPVDAESWIETHVPGTVSRRTGSDRHFELPQIPALGPLSFMVAQCDPSTICIGNNYRPSVQTNNLESENRKREFLGSIHWKPQANPSVWARPFDQVKGGVLTIAFSNEDIHIPEQLDAGDRTGTELECARILHRILHTFETFAMGLDANEDGTRLGIRVHISAGDEARQKILLSDVQALMQTATRHFDSHQDEADREIEDPKLREFCRTSCEQFLDRMVVERVNNPGDLPYVAIRSGIDTPSLGVLLTSLMFADRDLK